MGKMFRGPVATMASVFYKAKNPEDDKVIMFGGFIYKIVICQMLSLLGTITMFN